MFKIAKSSVCLVFAFIACAPAVLHADEPVKAASDTIDLVISPEDLAPAFKTAPALQALEHIERGRFDQARSVLLANADTVTADTPLSSRFLLAWSCYMTGDWLCVESVTAGMDSVLPQFSDYIVLMRAAALSGLANDRAAIALLETIPPGTPVRRDMLKLKAEVLVALGRDFEAASIIKALVDDRDADPGMIADLTDALLSSAKRDRAVAELKNLYFKSSSSGRGGLRGLLKKLGVATEPSQDEFMDRAWTLLNAHSNLDALKLVEPLTKSTDRARRCEALEIAARANSKLRRHADAVAKFRIIFDECRTQRDIPPLLYTAIRSAFKGGDNKTGEELAKVLASEYPSASYNDDIWVLRARMAIEQARNDDAVAILDESLRRWPDGDMATESRWLVAWSFVNSGKNGDALKRLEEGRSASATDPAWGPRFSYWKARILQRSGRTADAAAAYRECASRWPMTFYGLLSLNRLAEQEKKGAEAILRGIIADAGANGSQPVQRFLTLGRVEKNHPAARAVWLCRAGLSSLAMKELRQVDPADTSSGWLKALLLDRDGQYTASHRTARDLLLGKPFWPDAATAGYYKLSYPRPFTTQVRAAARESDVDPMLIWAVMRTESAFIPGVESWANASGLMQLIMPTAKSVARQLKINIDANRVRDPAINTRLGARYLRNLLDKFGNPILAIPGYNAGGGAISRWLGRMGDVQIDQFVESIPGSEARGYAQKVFEGYAAYSYLYGDQPYRPMKVDFRTSGR